MRKVAIACQGGGSQTAFTAGVLRAPFENGATREYEVVSLSGTSGGSKLTRGPDHIRALMADGEQQGRAFVEQYVAT